MGETMSPLELALRAEGVDGEAGGSRWALTGDDERTLRILRETDRVVVGVRAVHCVGVETMAGFDNWLPFLPIAGSDEASAIADLVREGTLGAVAEVDVTVGYGADRWDPQPTAAYPEAAFEAAVWGQHLLERVTSGPADLGSWTDLAGPGPARLGQGHLQDGSPARLRVVPAGRVPGPCWSAQVWFTGGHTAARTPLAPGRLTTWDTRRQELLSSNGCAIGKGAGNDALDGSALRELVRWASHGAAAPEDPERCREEALAVLARTDRCWSAGPSSPGSSPRPS